MLFSNLSNEYLGGTDIARSLKGVAEFRLKNDDEKVTDGGTDVDLAYLDESSLGTCLGTDEDLRALLGGVNVLLIPVMYR